MSPVTIKILKDGDVFHFKLDSRQPFSFIFRRVLPSPHENGISAVFAWDRRISDGTTQTINLLDKQRPCDVFMNDRSTHIIVCQRLTVFKI